MTRLSVALPGSSPITSASSAVAPERTRELAAKLKKLVAAFDASTMTFVEENEAGLRSAFDAIAWEQFLRQIQQFAFAEMLLDKALASCVTDKK